VRARALDLRVGDRIFSGGSRDRSGAGLGGLRFESHGQMELPHDVRPMPEPMQ